MKTQGIAITVFLVLISLPGCRNYTHQDVRTVTGDSLKQDSTQIMYVGTYTENQNNTNGKSTGIYVYELNTNNGRLTYVSSSPYTMNPSYLAADFKNKKMYAVNEIGGPDAGGGKVSAFKLSPDGRQIDFINSVSSQGNSPCYLSLDKTGRWVMCANYGSGNVAIFPVRDSGSLGEANMVHQHTAKGTPPRQESAHAHFILQNPSNDLIYSCDLGADTIYIYKLNATTGNLILTGHNYATRPGAGPRHLTFHPTLHTAYVVNELNGTVEVMNVDSVSGSLSRIQVITTLEPGVNAEAACADIHLAPSGKFLYASNRGSVNSLAIYQVDPHSGKLTILGHQAVKGKTPRNFIIDPSGKYLIVANQDSGNVVTFKINQETGMLEDTNIEIKIPSPVCLKFLI